MGVHRSGKMAKNRDILSYYLKHFHRLQSDYDSVRKNRERDFQIAVSEYADEIEKIRQQYAALEETKIVEYLKKETDYGLATRFVSDEYDQLFDRLEHDISRHEEEKARLIERENRDFTSVLEEISRMREQAENEFKELTSEIYKRIDHEMKVHHDFIEQEDGKFKSIQKGYQEINSEQANRLLWTIEASKNALIDLGQQLEENSIEHAKYMNESVLKVLEALRETKNRLTHLFKSTTEVFSRQKTKIERLNHERQKPHSDLNETIIRQYVRQIRDVNLKKTSFEQMIRQELKNSLKTIGERILMYDRDNNRIETEKAIMQYEIVKKKADYLLHRNSSLADLLISKYQNEIKKIKIDSFRRVEEIKLAYFMPAAFFQNSINLYSNFAFYVNESFDDLDNLLSDLIKYNQRITEVESNYVRESAKTAEDYKIKVMAQVNSVTQKLTDLITRIDQLSKDIVTLESNNQLEVAELRKKMETTDISGDYQKHLVSLDNDEYFACFQHDINMQKIKSDMAYEEKLFEIERSVTEIHFRQQIQAADKKHLLDISKHEKDIHDIAFDRELAYFFARFEEEKRTIRIRQEIDMLDLHHQMHRKNNLFAQKYEELRKEHLKNRSEGSQQVVEYVYNTQKLIDLNDSETHDMTGNLETSEIDRDYAYYLESMREKTVALLLEQARLKTQPNTQAIKLYHHHFHLLNSEIHSAIINKIDPIKRLLVNLDRDFSIAQAARISAYNAYLHPILETMEFCRDRVLASVTELRPTADLQVLKSRFNTSFEKFVILADDTLKAIKKYEGKGKPLQTILETFYVGLLSIMTSLDIEFKKAIDKTETELILNDVLYIDRVNNATKKTINMVEDEYDHLIYQALRMKRNQGKKKKHLARLTTELDEQLKRKVRNVNAAYMDTMRSEADKLQFIRRSLAKIVLDNDKAIALQDKMENQAFRLRLKHLDKRFNNFLKAYEHLKQMNQDAYNQEVNYLNKLSLAKDKAYADSLVALEKKMQSLPTTKTKLIFELESEKQSLIQKRRVDLLQQYAIIEGNKFTSRPKFLKEIEQVKNRLSDDYLKLYQEMQSAQKDFLDQYLTTESAFTEDFRIFLSNQQNYRKLIETDNITQKPFEDYFQIQTDLLKMTTDAYQTTIEKSDMTKAEIDDTETKSKQKQDRIING